MFPKGQMHGRVGRSHDAGFVALQFFTQQNYGLISTKHKPILRLVGKSRFMHRSQSYTLPKRTEKKKPGPQEKLYSNGGTRRAENHKRLLHFPQKAITSCTNNIHIFFFTSWQRFLIRDNVCLHLGTYVSQQFSPFCSPYEKIWQKIPIHPAEIYTQTHGIVILSFLFLH